MKSGYIAIAVVAMIAAVVLLSGCTSGPAVNTTVTPTVKVTVMPTAGGVNTVPVAGPVDAQNTSMGAVVTVTPWPELRSGNNTSIINTTEGMREVPNTMLVPNNTSAQPVVVSPVVSPTAMP